jgi:hypothetical protein
VAPTLVKYANPSRYEIATRHELAVAAAELMSGISMQPAPLVDLVDDSPLEIELAATLIYSGCHHSYRQILEVVQGLSPARQNEIIDLGLRHRGQHDELLRQFQGGQHFCFDILMDIGGYRDMHRHRRCTQIEQGFTRMHGYDTPPDIATAGLAERYWAAMQRVVSQAEDLETINSAASVYLLPMAFRKRTLFKMDFAEALYIAELRSAPAGHFSYRNVASAMYEEIVRKHPALRSYFKVTSVHEPLDLLKR